MIFICEFLSPKRIFYPRGFNLNRCQAHFKGHLLSKITIVVILDIQMGLQREGVCEYVCVCENQTVFDVFLFLYSLGFKQAVGVFP